MRRPQNSFEPYPGCHNYPIWAPNDLDLGKKQKLDLKEAQKIIFLVPKWPPISRENQISDLEENKKTKVALLYHKTFLHKNPT